MIAFGIDPGSRRTGWGVVRAEGSSLMCIDYDVILARTDAPLCERLETIFTSLCQVLDRHRPDAVFVESVFHHKSAASALVLGQARGVALLAARMKAARVDELSPAEVKKVVTGRGRAEKDQVKQMVRILLGLPSLPSADAADALAIAVAGATHARWSERAAPRVD